MTRRKEPRQSAKENLRSLLFDARIRATAMMHTIEQYDDDACRAVVRALFEADQIAIDPEDGRPSVRLVETLESAARDVVAAREAAKRAAVDPGAEDVERVPYDPIARRARAESAYAVVVGTK
jgi:hypothetical protein